MLSGDPYGMALRKIGAPAAAAVALMVAMGCGEEVIDATKVEDSINQNIQETGVAGQVKSVECPEDEPSEDGHRFDCKVIRTDGGTEAIPVVVTDGEAGNVSFGKEAQ